MFTVYWRPDSKSDWIREFDAQNLREALDYIALIPTLSGQFKCVDTQTSLNCILVDATLKGFL